jgi:hypothetical protein
MRPIRKTVTATGTYYFPLSRLTDETVIQIALSGLTITSVEWTTENVRAAAGAINAPANAVAAADAQWTAIAADADGSYRITWPIDTVRVTFGGAGSATVSVLQLQTDNGGD